MPGQGSQSQAEPPMTQASRGKGDETASCGDSAEAKVPHQPLSFAAL